MFKDYFADLPENRPPVKGKLEEVPWLESYPLWQLRLIMCLPFVAMLVDIFD